VMVQRDRETEREGGDLTEGTFYDYACELCCLSCGGYGKEKRQLYLCYYWRLWVIFLLGLII
jgi:hypothetical protein